MDSKSHAIVRAITLLLGGILIVAAIFYAVSFMQKKDESTQNMSSNMSSPQGRALAQNAPDLPKAWNPDGTPTDMTKWPKVLVPAHGDSARVPSVPGGHIVWGGSGFEVRFVYADGHECVIGDPSPKCGDGNIVAGYARNNGGSPLYASYAYASQTEK